MKKEEKAITAKKTEIAEEKTSPVIPRHQAFIFLAVKFIKDYKEMLSHFSLDQQIELTEHLMEMIELMEKNLKQYEEANYYEYLKREAQLLKKYGRILRPFAEKSFIEYFSYEGALIRKGIYTQEQVQSFFHEQGMFMTEEAFDFQQLCIGMLIQSRNELYLQKDPEWETNQKHKFGYNIQWTPRKENKNEFVQLVYALHLAGYINNGEGEVMKIVEALARALNLELSKGWHSNHSNSIHRQNVDYQPPIFKTLVESYLKYSKNLREQRDK